MLTLISNYPGFYPFPLKFGYSKIIHIQLLKYHILYWYVILVMYDIVPYE